MIGKGLGPRMKFINDFTKYRFSNFNFKVILGQSKTLCCVFRRANRYLANVRAAFANSDPTLTS